MENIHQKFEVHNQFQDLNSSWSMSSSSFFGVFLMVLFQAFQFYVKSGCNFNFLKLSLISWAHILHVSLSLAVNFNEPTIANWVFYAHSFNMLKPSLVCLIQNTFYIGITKPISQLCWWFSVSKQACDFSGFFQNSNFLIFFCQKIHFWDSCKMRRKSRGRGVDEGWGRSVVGLDKRRNLYLRNCSCSNCSKMCYLHLIF